jgi:hypothetical protein
MIVYRTSNVMPPMIQVVDKQPGQCSPGYEDFDTWDQAYMHLLNFVRDAQKYRQAAALQWGEWLIEATALRAQVKQQAGCSGPVS